MDMLHLTKITLAWELYNQGIPQTHIAEHVQVDRVTVYRWLQGILKSGNIETFFDLYISAKKGERTKRKIDGLLKTRVWTLREKYRDCCGQKIRYFLKEEHGVDLGVKAIYKILGEKYKLRTKWKKNKARGPVPQAQSPREVIQMDTVDFGEVFAFTGVDIYTKEADVLLRPSLTGQDGYLFLKTSMNRRFNNHVKLLQTDGGPEFKEAFTDHVFEYAQRHRIARPYKKNEQSYIESFNRSLRKECLGWGKYGIKDIPTLTQETKQYLEYYHYTRPHIGLNMRPPLQ